MNDYSGNSNTDILQTKGGVMLFSVQRPEKVYRGIVFLSPVRDSHHRRVICMREYNRNNT